MRVTSTPPSTSSAVTHGGIGQEAPATNLLLPDVQGNRGVAIGEATLSPCPNTIGDSRSFIAGCPTSAAVLTNGSVVHPQSSSSLQAPLVGVGGDHIIINTHQQQGVVGDTATATPGLISSTTDQSSSSLLHNSPQQAHPSSAGTQHAYNGIFLVDGLGQGVRIDGNGNHGRGVLGTEVNIGQTQTYGLALPVYSDQNNLSPRNEPTLLPGAQLTSAQSQLATNNNPLCIRIDSNHAQQAGTNLTIPSFLIDDHFGVLGNNTRMSTEIHNVNAVGTVSLSQPCNVPGLSSVGNFSINHCITNDTSVPMSPNGSSVTIPVLTHQFANFPVSSPLVSALMSPSSIVPIDSVSDQLHVSSTVVSPQQSPTSPPPQLPPRNVTSSESQTDDLPVLAPPPSSKNREQRKRERRERRRERSHNLGRTPQESGQTTAPLSPPSRSHRSNADHGIPDASRPPSVLLPTAEHGPASPGTCGLPDLLNSHFPPPYSTLPVDRRLGLPSPILPPPPVTLIPQPPPTLLAPPPAACLPSPTQPFRYHFSPGVRTSRRSLRAPRGVPYASEEEPKSCCGMSTSQAVSIRWFIIVIAVIGICCTVAGTALGAARSAGKEHLTLSLLMIGVGVVLLTVSAVAWRLTANESGTSCRAMLGFARNGSSRGDGGAEPNRRFVPRLPPSYGRPHHPYAAMMYPEFQYRPPPPSYQASMQEYRLRLLLLERSNPTIAAAASLASPNAFSMVPPPPAYRPYNCSIRPPPNLRSDIVDYSRPPSYRSRSSGNSGAEGNGGGNRPSLDPGVSHQIVADTPLHSRDPSVLSYLSQHSLVDTASLVAAAGSTGGLVQGEGIGSSATVVTVMQAVSVDLNGLDMSSLAFDPRAHKTPALEENKEHPDTYDDSDKGSKNKDGNLVRIVQTIDSSQVIGRDSVIVTVSGSNNALWDQSLQNATMSHANSRSSTVYDTNSDCTAAVQILAHL